jgi:quinol monooxygenase YgiN
MITYVASIKVEPEKQAEFEALMGDLMKAVHANEPGIPFYQLCRMPSDPRAYRMIEFYDDQAAIDHHMQTEWFQKAAARFGEFFAEPPTLEQLETVF